MHSHLPLEPKYPQYSCEQYSYRSLGDCCGCPNIAWLENLNLSLGCCLCVLHSGHTLAADPSFQHRIGGQKPLSWGEWNSQGSWWPRTRRVSVTLRKVVTGKVLGPGVLCCAEKALAKRAPNNLNNRTCPYLHSLGGAKGKNPKQSRKAEPAWEHPRTQRKKYSHRKRKGRWRFFLDHRNKL